MNHQNIICVIPARSGSERIKNKNLIRINNITLIEYTILHALKSKLIDRNIYVSSDSKEILDIANKYNVKGILRPKNISNNKASSESALIHALDHYKKVNKTQLEPEILVFLQCTSPFREDEDIDNAIKIFKDKNFDSLLSVTNSKKFLWRGNNNNKFLAINYDIEHRSREQDIKNQFEENGSIYICKTKNLRYFKNRLSGKVGFYKMHPYSNIQIDEETDLILASAVLKNQRYKLPKEIELIVMDFDGIFTDDYVIQDQNGKESIIFSRKDGYAVKQLKENGFQILVLSSEKNSVVKKRAEKLGLRVKHGVESKIKFLKKFLSSNNYNKKNVIYIGNDINDLECMEYVGFPVTVSDAVEKIKKISNIILMHKGGKGAIRELSDIILDKKNYD